jgi:hypothetical protein
MYESHAEALIPPRAFLRRMLNHVSVALALVICSLGVGVLGYHLLEGLPWIDALVNASMLLGGMGPVDPMHTIAGKVFASFYALYSGLIFLVVAGILFVPIFHRILHRFHLDDEDDEPENT